MDTLDGFVLALSPWAVRNLRFDESLGQLHGYDLDFCLQVREAGRKVVTADFRAIHHHALELVSDPEHWIDAHIKVAEKWDGRMPGVGDGRRRAGRSEPGGPRPKPRRRGRLNQSNALEADARVRELERALAETTGAASRGASARRCVGSTGCAAGRPTARSNDLGCDGR